MVLAAVPGERWKVEFFSDGKVEVFGNSSGVFDEEELKRLIRENADVRTRSISRLL